MVLWLNSLIFFEELLTKNYFGHIFIFSKIKNNCKLLNYWKLLEIELAGTMG